MKKTILITGSTDGIGKLAAVKLAKDGHSVYIHGRNSEKLAAVISEIKEQSNNENIKGFLADLSDLDAVRQMATKVRQDIPQLDVLINNAGVFNSPVDRNKEGLEIRFVVNYFAPYLLTQSLLPLLQKSQAPRIINLSSAAQAPVSLEALAGKAQPHVQQAYAQSKLALTMWSFRLAKAASSVITIAVNPGSLLNTNMVREAFGRYWSSADKGANILYDLALSEEYDNASGKYFDNDKGSEKGTFGKAHANAYDEAAIDQLLAATEQILGV